MPIRDHRRAVTIRGAALVLLAYALHFTWEMAQAGLFTTMNDLPIRTATAWCARAAGWDVVIGVFAYAAAALAAKTWRWPREGRVLPLSVYLAAGLAVTIAIERWALGVGRWRYAPSMPTVGGIGVSPLLQWIVVPLLVLALVRVAFPLRRPH